MDLYRGAANLDIDPPPSASLSFKKNLLKIASSEIEWRIEQELAGVGLHVGLGPTPCACSESTSYRAKIVHGDVRYAAGLASARWHAGQLPTAPGPFGLGAAEPMGRQASSVQRYLARG